MLLLMRREDEEILIGSEVCIRVTAIKRGVVELLINDEPVTLRLDAVVILCNCDIMIVKIRAKQVTIGITAEPSIVIARLEVANKELLDAHGRT